MAIGRKLSDLLKVRGTNPNQLAKATGVNVNTIYGIIRRNNKKFPLDDLQVICKHLGVTLDYFSESDDFGIDIDSRETQEAELLASFWQLNDEGQSALIAQAEIMTSMPQYKKGSETAKNDEPDKKVV